MNAGWAKSIKLYGSAALLFALAAAAAVGVRFAPQSPFRVDDAPLRLAMETYYLFCGVKPREGSNIY